MYSHQQCFLRTNLILWLLILSAGINLYSQTFSKIDSSVICSMEGTTVFSSWTDINNDGMVDLIVLTGNIEESDGAYTNALFINKGDWVFSRITDDPVVTAITAAQGSYMATWGDYDNDGYTDLFVSCLSFQNNQLFHNNGDGSFSKISSGEIVHDGDDSGPCNWVDIDNDSYLDLVVTNLRMQKNLIYHNNGNGTFTRLTEGILANLLYHRDYGSSWCDIDNDGDLDDFGASFYNPKRYLLMNDGYGNFEMNETSGLTIDDEATWGWFPPAWGDYNNDGWQDVYIATWGPDWSLDYDLLYKNNGDGTFTRVSDVDPVAAKTALEGGWWGDLDNDGYLDLIVSSYYGTTIIYRNNHDETFTALDNNDLENGGYVNIIDINRDGFLDLFIARGYSTGKNLLYANTGNSNSWLSVKPVGTVSNKSGIGSKVRIKATIGGKAMWQTRETGLTANGLDVHFGLGDATKIDSLIIQWPSGIDTVLKDIDVNQHLIFTEQVPPGYLKAGFALDTTFGRKNLEVHFKDISRYDPDIPVTSWSWDFDGDGNEDSNEPNPVYTYSNPDEVLYTVSLKISNGSDTSELVKNGIIRIQKDKPGMEDNLAQWSVAATSSSVYAGYWLAISAVDNNINSHWRSELTKNDEWLKVELDTLYELGKVIIEWEKVFFFSRNYELQTSVDGENWNTVACNSNGDGENDTLFFTGTEARYVKLFMPTPGSNKQYSVSEFKIYLSDGNEYESGCETGVDKISFRYGAYVHVFPNPMTRDVTFSFALPEPSKVEVKLYDLTGRETTTVFRGYLPSGKQSTTWSRNSLKGGIYFYEIKVDTGKRSQQFTGKLVILE